MLRVAIVVACLLMAGPALAQSAYVAGTIGADVSRSSKSESDGFEHPNGDGEVFSGALRLGTSFVEPWGIELEFVRPAEIESTSSGFGVPRPLAAGSSSTVIDSLRGLAPVLYPAIVFDDIRVRQRNTTVSTLAWVRHRVNDSFDLVYLGGLSFSRLVQEMELRYVASPQFGGVLLPRLISLTRVTAYGVGPVVGMEGRLAMTAHLRLVPGIRLHGVGGDMLDGWLIRPSVGLAWAF